MIPKFQFKGFQPDDHLTAETEGVLEQIQDQTHLDATIVSMLEYDGSTYACSIDVFLKHRSVFANTMDVNPFQALHRARQTLVEKLSKVKDTRVLNRKPEALTKKSPYPFEPVEQS